MMTARQVKYKILSVDRSRKNAVVVEYEYCDCLYQATIMVSMGHIDTTGCKKHTDMHTGEVKIASVTREEGELLLALARQFDCEQRAQIPDVLE
jgi:hypothetical protein